MICKAIVLEVYTAGYKNEAKTLFDMVQKLSHACDNTSKWVVRLPEDFVSWAGRLQSATLEQHVADLRASMDTKVSEDYCFTKALEPHMQNVKNELGKATRDLKRQRLF